MSEADDRLRKAAYPLELTWEVWEPRKHKTNPLDAVRVRRRLEYLDLSYARLANSMRRAWDYRGDLYDEQAEQFLSTRLGEHEPSKDFGGVKYALDIDIALWKMWANWRYARANDNPWLFRDSIDSFPCMDYVLREGPVEPSADSVFGIDDMHAMVRADGNRLVYLVPRRDGIDKGYYIETYT